MITGLNDEDKRKTIECDNSLDVMIGISESKIRV